MIIKATHSDGALLLSLNGELDHHAAKGAIPEISEYIEVNLPANLILDFQSVRFMDSSGIALVIGAYKKITLTGGSFAVVNVSPQAYKVFAAAEICKLINITPTQISIKGAI